MCDKKGCDPIRKEYHIGYCYTLMEFFARAAFIALPILSGARSDEELRHQQKEAIESFQVKYMLNLIVSLGENMTASVVGHGVLALMRYSTFSFQQALIDGAVATLPSLVPFKI